MDSHKRALTWSLVAVGIAGVVLAAVLLATFPWGQYGQNIQAAAGQSATTQWVWHARGPWMMRGLALAGGSPLFVIGMIVLRLLGLAFAVLLVVRIALAARWRRGAEATLARRFAAGEITEEQYRHMRDTLES